MQEEEEEEEEGEEAAFERLMSSMGGMEVAELDDEPLNEEPLPSHVGYELENRLQTALGAYRTASMREQGSRVALRRFAAAGESEEVLLQASLSALAVRTDGSLLQAAGAEVAVSKAKEQALSEKVSLLEDELAALKRLLDSEKQIRANLISPVEATTDPADDVAKTGKGAGPSEVIDGDSPIGQTPATTTNGHELDPEAIIQRIRAEMGSDADPNLPPAAREGLQAMRDMLGRALHAISRDLYASSARFLGELIQNADDNTYAPGLVPTLAVHVVPGSITCVNNEVGFSEQDVLAICNVGQSTKAQRVGAIGRKGIGFKSVFMVSDRPHILSNGFRFCFDRTGAGGLLQPHWVTTEQWAELEVSSPGALHGVQMAQASTIHLPLTTTARARPPALTFHAPCLLFLHKLRMFHVLNESAAGARTLRSFSRLMETETRSGVCVLEEVEYEGGHDADSSDGWQVVGARRSQQWLVHRQQIRVPSGLAQGRGGTGETEVALAFHIDGRVGDDDAKDYPCIYAFLPVCNAGLPFLVHCDFHVVSSREQLHKDDLWNLWLRDQLPAVFKSALAHPLLRERVLTFVPKLGAVTDDFWLPLAAQLRDLVQEEQCVRSEEGAWCRPRELLSRPMQGVFSTSMPLLSSQELEACLGLTFSAEPYRVGNHAHPFLPSHLLACLQHPSFAHSLHTRPVSFHVAACEFISGSLEDATLQGLRDVPIFVLRTPREGAVGNAADPSPPHRLAALRHGPIFSALPVEIQESAVDKALGVLRVLDPAYLVLPACLSTLGILPATLPGAVESIMLSHWEGSFSSADEIWDSLSIVQIGMAAFLNEASDPTRALADLRSCLLAPCGDGTARAVSELSLRSFLGIDCPVCFGVPDGRPDPRDTRSDRSGLPVSMIPSASQPEVGEASSPLGGLRIESLFESVQGPTGEGRAVSAFLSTMSLETDHGAPVDGWYGARASTGTRRGKFRFDVRVLRSSGTSHAYGDVANGSTEGCSQYSQWRVGLGVAATTPETLGGVGWAVDGEGLLHMGGRAGRLCPPLQGGDVLTFAVDLDGQLASFALNGRLLPTPRITVTTTTTNIITTTTSSSVGFILEGASEVSWCVSALRVPAAVRGGFMIPMAAYHVSDASASPTPSTALAFNFGRTGMQEVPGLGGSFCTLGEVITTKETLSCIAPPLDHGGDALLTEAFLLKCGARTHFDICTNRHWWLGIEDAPWECCVCMEELLLSEPVRLPCMHCFHRSCVEKWAEIVEEEPTCPVCRRAFTVGEVVRVTPHPVRGAEDVLQSTLMDLGRDSGGDANTLKLTALRRYTEEPFARDVLRSMEVITTQGLKRVDQTLLVQTFRPVGGPGLPYLILPAGRAPSAPLLALLSELGVACSSSRLPDLLVCLRALAASVPVGGQPNSTHLFSPSRLEAFARLYHLLQALLASQQDATDTEHSSEHLDYDSSDACELLEVLRAEALVFGGEEVEWGGVRIVDVRLFNGFEMPPLHRLGQLLWTTRSAVSDLLGLPPLRSLFPSLGPFYRDMLRIPSVDVSHCLKALSSLTLANPLPSAVPSPSAGSDLVSPSLAVLRVLEDLLRAGDEDAALVLFDGHTPLFLPAIWRGQVALIDAHATELFRDDATLAELFSLEVAVLHASVRPDAYPLLFQRLLLDHISEDGPVRGRPLLRSLSSACVFSPALPLGARVLDPAASKVVSGLVLFHATTAEHYSPAVRDRLTSSHPVRVYWCSQIQRRVELVLTMREGSSRQQLMSHVHWCLPGDGGAYLEVIMGHSLSVSAQRDAVATSVAAFLTEQAEAEEGSSKDEYDLLKRYGLSYLESIRAFSEPMGGENDDDIDHIADQMLEPLSSSPELAASSSFSEPSSVSAPPTSSGPSTSSSPPSSSSSTVTSSSDLVPPSTVPEIFPVELISPTISTSLPSFSSSPLLGDSRPDEAQDLTVPALATSPTPRPPRGLVESGVDAFADGTCGPLDLRWVERLLPTFSALDHPDQLPSQFQAIDVPPVSGPASVRPLHTRSNPSNAQSVQAFAEAVNTY